MTLKEYPEYNTFDYKTCNMHMTCENNVVTSNLYKKSSHFALLNFKTSKSLFSCIL